MARTATGVVRRIPVARPGTESRRCEPGPIPRRSKTMLIWFACFNQRGGRRGADVAITHRHPPTVERGSLETGDCRAFDLAKFVAFLSTQVDVRSPDILEGVDR